MLKYTLKRLAQSLVTIFLAVTLVFLLLRLLPTDYFFTEDQLMKLTEEQKDAQLQAAGLLDPPGTQLIRYYGQLLHLDFGVSRRIQSGVPVTKVIGSKFKISMRLGLISLVIALTLGVTLGVLQTVRKEKLLDHVGTTYTVFVNAVPPLVSYSLVLVFGAKVLGLPPLYSRRYMVDELTRDYIKLAKIKGLNTREIMVGHVMRNAMVPMVQYIPAALLETIGGSLLVERFFSVPGMGPLLTDAINRYDTNVVQTLVILYATIGILGVFLGDLAMMMVDPRITLVGKEEAR